MKAYNIPTDELHINSNAGEELVSITPEKAMVKNLDVSSMGITSSAEEIDAAVGKSSMLPTLASGSTDNGKVLTADSTAEGGTKWKAVPKELPTIGSGDSGKVLTVNQAHNGVLWQEASGGDIFIAHLSLDGTTLAFVLDKTFAELQAAIGSEKPTAVAVGGRLIYYSSSHISAGHTTLTFFDFSALNIDTTTNKLGFEYRIVTIDDTNQVTYTDGMSAQVKLIAYTT